LRASQFLANAGFFGDGLEYFIVNRMRSRSHNFRYSAAHQRYAPSPSTLWFVAAAFVLLLLVPKAALAKWQKVTANETGTIYVDDATLQSVGAVKTFESLMDYRSPKQAPAGANFVSTRTSMEMDCRKKQVHMLKFSMYSGPMLTGTLVDTQGVIRPWQDVPANTPLENIFRYVCK